MLISHDMTAVSACVKTIRCITAAWCITAINLSPRTCSKSDMNAQ